MWLKIIVPVHMIEQAVNMRVRTLASILFCISHSKQYFPMNRAMH